MALENWSLPDVTAARNQSEDALGNSAFIASRVHSCEILQFVLFLFTYRDV